MTTRHQALIQSCNSNHFLAAGWLASPNGIEYDDVASEAIYDKFGCWEHLTPAEFENGKEESE